MTNVLIRDKWERDTEKREGHVEERGRELWELRSHKPKECLKPPEAERYQKGFSPRLFGGSTVLLIP